MGLTAKSLPSPGRSGNLRNRWQRWNIGQSGAESGGLPVSPRGYTACPTERSRTVGRRGPMRPIPAKPSSPARQKLPLGRVLPRSRRRVQSEEPAA
jgi:hypothetical protein